MTPQAAEALAADFHALDFPLGPYAAGEEKDWRALGDLYRRLQQLYYRQVGLCGT